MKKNKTGSI